MKTKKTLAERFWAKVDKSGLIPAQVPELGPCWVWTASRHPKGYGWFQEGVRLRKAHQVAWFLERGHWPEMCVLHRCDNPPCVRYSHLFEGTQADNVRDMIEKGRMRTGDRSWSRMHPERLARGDRHGSRLHPEAMRPVRGEDHAFAKLTEEQVREIVRRKNGGENQRLLALEFGLSQSTVSDLGRRTWLHLVGGGASRA